MTLIKGWKTWHKWWSIRLKLVGLLLIAAPEAVITAWATMPHDIKESIPNEWITAIGIFLVVASSFAQLVRQRKPHERAESERLTGNESRVGEPPKGKPGSS